MFDTYKWSDLDETSGPKTTQANADRPPDPEPPPLHAADAEDELLAILSRIDRLEAQAAKALASINDAAMWRRKGYTSATAFLKHRAAMAAGPAMRFVGRSNSLTRMPVAAAALDIGSLSVGQADVLCDAYNFNNSAYLEEEATLVGLAEQLPFVHELGRLMEYWKQRVDPTLAELDQDMVNSLRGVRIRREAGVGRAYVCLPEGEFDVFLNQLEPGPPLPADNRSLSQRRADRLVELAAEKMDRPEIVVHTSPLDASPVGHTTPGTPADAAPPVRLHGETESGAVLTPEAILRYACDATVCRIVFGPDSQILDVGRKLRLFTAPQRRAIEARDRHCRFPGCDRPPKWCDTHHIRHWLNGGTTSVDNGVLLCRFHHTLIHEAGWRLVGTPQHLIVYDDVGKIYATSLPPPPMLA